MTRLAISITPKQAGITLLLASAALHLWRLDVPREVVFDEVHFGKFANSYCCTHERVFDIHPPLVKLLFAGIGKLAGLDGKFSFAQIGQPYGLVPIFWLRFLPAIAGTLLPVVAFWLLLLLGAQIESALLGGILFCLENATLLEGRLMLMDTFLLLGILGALLFAVKAREGGLGHTALSGLFAAFACQTKFTGAVTLLAPILLWRGKRSRLAIHMLIYGSVFLVAYTAPWFLHFSLLPKPGFGDVFIKPTGHFFPDLFALHRVMYTANSGIATNHPDASPWWAWPLLKTPPFYWTKDSSFIYLFGNPVLWWGGLVGVLSAGAHALCGLVYRARRLPFRIVSLLILYTASYAPLIPVKRPLFLYHYLTPLWLSVLVTVLWLEHVGWLVKLRYWILGAAVVCFVLILPLTYGLTVPQAYLRFLYWRPEFYFR